VNSANATITGYVHPKAQALPRKEPEYRLAAVMSFYEDRKQFYDKWSSGVAGLNTTLQLCAILLGGASPVLAAFDAPRAYVALVGALAAAAAATNTTFRFGRERVRQAMTHRALEIEKMRFEARTGEYAGLDTEDKLINMFQRRITTIVKQEVKQWASEENRSSELPAESGAPGYQHVAHQNGCARPSTLAMAASYRYAA
jgi:hypothetical protein